jgi:site-specific DNA-methyltransferase (adenine-specific)
MELNKIYNEDCLIGMSRIPDKSVDMILCDLPYGTTACKWDVIIPFKPLWEQYERIIKDNGAIVLTASQPFTTDLINSNRKLFRYEMIWDKQRPCGSQLAKVRPLKYHENILMFYRKHPTYNPQMTRGKMQSKAGFSGKGSDNYVSSTKTIRYQSDLYYPRSIVEVKGCHNMTGKVHPTEKPTELFEYLIKTYTNEGETVLDNCMGSGTTAIACMNTNRNYIGFEKEEKYYQIIQDRIKKHTPQLKLIA